MWFLGEKNIFNNAERPAVFVIEKKRLLFHMIRNRVKKLKRLKIQRAVKGVEESRQ